MVQQLLDMEPPAWQYQVQHARSLVAQLSQTITALQAHISLQEIPVSLIQCLLLSTNKALLKRSVCHQHSRLAFMADGQSCGAWKAPLQFW